jgi:hypothetical protein
MMTPVNILDKDKTLLVRQGFVLAFFANRPFLEVADGVGRALDEWLEIVDRKNIKWSLVGSSATTHAVVTNRTLDQCRSMLDKTKAAERKTTAFKLMGPEKYNPANRFVAVGPGALGPEATDASLLEITLPWETVESPGADALVQFSLKIAAVMPYDSGYLSPALNWGKDSRRAEAGAAMIGPAMRHPGLDIHMNNATRFGIGRLSRGARWITFLGPHSIRELGGDEQIPQKAPSGVDVMNAGAGLAIRVSKAPALGDVNRKDNLPFLRAVARMIEPVTYFGDEFLESALFPEDPEAYQRWERRLLS